MAQLCNYAHRYWGEIISHRYLFDQRAQKSALLASITLADVRSAFNTWVTDRSSRRKLSVELFGNGFETRQPFTPQVPASIPILPDNYTRSEGGDDVVDYAVLEQAFMQMGDRIAFQSGKETFDTLAVNNAH